METCRRENGAAGNTTLNAVPGITGVTRYPTSTWLSAKTGASGSPPTAEKVIEVSPKGVQLAPPVVGSIPMQTRTPVFAVEAPCTALVMLSKTRVLTAVALGADVVAMEAPPCAEYWTPWRGAAASDKTTNQK